MMTSYVKCVFLWIFITKGQEGITFRGDIPQKEAFRIFNQDNCPIKDFNYLTTFNAEPSAKCSLTVDYEDMQRRNGFHEKNLYLLSGENTFLTRRKMPTCSSSELEQILRFTCTIPKTGSIGDLCISNKNCINNTVCNIDSFFGRCTCQNGLNEDNGHCIKKNVPLGGICVKNENCEHRHTYCLQSRCECVPGYSNSNGYCIIKKVKPGEQCYYTEQCGQSHTECYHQKCSCIRGYIQVENNCVEGNMTLGSRCQYQKQCTATPNAGVCRGSSSYLKCRCNSGFVEINGSCVENLKLGENCTTSNQCRQLNAECRKTQCICKSGYLQIENHCVEENKTIGSQCLYHEQCTGTLNAGLCLGNSSYLQCGCDVGFVDINESCIGNLKLGEICSLNEQCQQPDALCTESYCSCKSGYLQIENNCVEGNKAINVPCMYHQQCTRTPNASLCAWNSSSFLCSCVVGFLESNGSCIEMPELIIPKRDRTFFDSKAFVAILSGIIGVIFGASLAVLVFVVYTNKSRSLGNGQNSKDSHQHQIKKDLKCSTTDNNDSQNGIEMQTDAINDKRGSDSGNEVAHQENSENQSNLDHDPCLYNHLNEKDELDNVRENDYSTAQKESQNDAGDVYAQVQSRKDASKQSKQFIVDDVYMPVNEGNKF